MNAGISTADQGAGSRRPRLRASRAGGRDDSRDQSSDGESQEREDSGENNNTADDAGRSPPGGKDQPPEAPLCTCPIVIAVKKCWASSEFSALYLLACQCNDGVLVIRGSVRSYYFKQLAQESIRSVEGVKRIVNELIVRESSGTESNSRQESDDRTK